MTLAARQLLFARYVDDEQVESEVRRDPATAAERHSVPLAFAEWLAGLPAQRVASFRRSRAHKEAVRAGKPPTRM